MTRRTHEPSPSDAVAGTRKTPTKKKTRTASDAAAPASRTPQVRATAKKAAARRTQKKTAESRGADAAASATAAAAETQAAHSRRVIKKYPNRRLYDTATSNYITLAEVRQLVMQQVPLVVRDAKDDSDLTRSILLQIILEEEAAGAPMFSEAALAQIIRFSGHAMQSFMAPYLESSLQAARELQNQLVASMPGGEQAARAPELWTQLLSQPASLQPPAMGSFLQRYQQQSQQLFEQMQTQMQQQFHQQAEQVMNAWGFKRS